MVYNFAHTYPKHLLYIFIWHRDLLKEMVGRQKLSFLLSLLTQPFFFSARKYVLELQCNKIVWRSSILWDMFFVPATFSKWLRQLTRLKPTQFTVPYCDCSCWKETFPYHGATYGFMLSLTYLLSWRYSGLCSIPLLCILIASNDFKIFLSPNINNDSIKSSKQ